MGKQWKQYQTWFFLGSKITTDGECSHEIKRRLLLGRKVMTNLDSIFKSRDMEKEMATHSSTLAWKIRWTEKPGRLQSMGSQRVRHDWATSLTHSVNDKKNFKSTTTNVVKVLRFKTLVEPGSLRYKSWFCHFPQVLPLPFLTSLFWSVNEDM